MSHISHLETRYGLRVRPLGQARRLRAWPALVATLALWGKRRHTRQHLSQLDDRALADVGLTRAQQRRERGKWFWRL
jgi:uncharacterized protein YjiS (DUF1127 family)